MQIVRLEKSLRTSAIFNTSKAGTLVKPEIFTKKSLRGESKIKEEKFSKEPPQISSEPKCAINNFGKKHSRKEPVRARVSGGGSHLIMYVC